MADCFECGSYLTPEDLIKKAIKCSGSKSALVLSWTLLNQIPFKSDALFWLNGTIQTVEGVSSFVDWSGNNRHFLITGLDFDPTFKGLPYKTAATISAPVDDAALIAADINSYLYTAGTPNQIPVVSLFQDVDYEHKLFTRHEAQVVDANGVETYEPRVLDIALYANVKADADLIRCQTYYYVPVEDVSTMVWLSPIGNDLTGNGTKASPYRSFDKIKTTTKATVYCKTGDYSPATLVTLTGTPINIIGVGLNTIVYPSMLIGLRNTRDLLISGFIINSNATTYNIYSNGGDLTVSKCKMVSDGSGYYYIDAVKSFVSQYCVFTSNNFWHDNTELSSIFNTCLFTQSINDTETFDKLLNSKLITNLTINNAGGKTIEIKGNTIIADVSGIFTSVIYNKITGNVTSKILTYTNNVVLGKSNLTPINNLSVKNNILKSSSDLALRIKGNNNDNTTGIEVENNVIIGNSNSATYIVFVGESESGGINSINAAKIRYNKIVNEHAGGTGTCHTLFVGGGINHLVQYNYIEASNGYGIVIKAGGAHYTTNNGHISYNVFKITNNCNYAILNRGAYGVNCFNNTILTYKSNTCIDVNDNSSAQDNSLLCENNIMQLGGNTTAYYSGINNTVINNAINKNGFTLTQDIAENDEETLIQINLNGIPATAITGANLGEDCDTGLDVTTNWGDSETIPVIVTKQQGETWQKGAFIQ